MDTLQENEEKSKLKRRISLFGVTAYGVGNVLGAGIYALIGEIVGITGNISWLAFILAAIAAAFTGLSYAELASMFPKSAAEFVYSEEAFKVRILSFILGWIIIFSGILSASTVALGFAEYFSNLIGLPSIIIKVTFAISLIIILSIINFLGIRTSTWTNLLFTLIEAGGLIFIIIIGIPFIGTVNYLEFPIGSGFESIFIAVALIFFAYIGFEDIANVAEEAKEPQKNVPKAIIYSIIVTTILYCLTLLSVVSIAPYSDIANSNAPLTYVVTTVLGPIGGIIMAAIALFATANTVLIMLIVTSRMIYGMARDKALPNSLANVSPKHKIPTISVFLTMILTIIPVFFVDISIVANATVFGVLINFCLVNICLITLRRRQPELKRPFKLKPNLGWMPLIPLLGAIVCIALLFTFDLMIILIQTIIVVIGIIVFYAMKLKMKALK